jgi:multiple antibiotic resistance protein
LLGKILPRRKLYAVEVRPPFGQSIVTDHLQAIITVLSLVNPFMCAAIFVQIEAGKSPRSQLGSATKVALAVLVILTVAAAGGGERASSLWRVAGCVHGGRRWGAGLAGILHAPRPPATGKPDANPSLTPLILFAASPGTITGVITLSVAHAKSGIPVTALVAVAVATTVMWLSILIVSRLGGRGSGGFVHDAVTRFMGLIVIAMGIQFALTGMRSFMRTTTPTLTYSDREPAECESSCFGYHMTASQ